LRLIEIVGPAGSGKTTLVRALRQRHPPLVAGVTLSKLRLAPHVAANALRLLPAYLARHRNTRWLDRRELRAMAYVNAWYRAVKGRRGADGVLVFDHGPVFRLVRLRAFGPKLVLSDAFRRWSKAAIHDWATALDTVVWLDAPDEALAQRIQSRPDWHRVKSASDAEIRGFLSRYRECYREVMSELLAIRAIRVLEFRTQEQRAEDIAETLLRALDLASGVPVGIPA
jgi:thymidylate kinase